MKFTLTIVILPLIIATVIVGCSDSTSPKTITCSTVEILDVADGNTLMEVAGPEPRARMLRSGNFGKVGDKFRYCD